MFPFCLTGKKEKKNIVLLLYVISPSFSLTTYIHMQGCFVLVVSSHSLNCRWWAPYVAAQSAESQLTGRVVSSLAPPQSLSLSSNSSVAHLVIKFPTARFRRQREREPSSPLTHVKEKRGSYFFFLFFKGGTNIQWIEPIGWAHVLCRELRLFGGLFFLLVCL